MTLAGIVRHWIRPNRAGGSCGLGGHISCDGAHIVEIVDRSTAPTGGVQRQLYIEINRKKGEADDGSAQQAVLAHLSSYILERAMRWRLHELETYYLCAVAEALVFMRRG